MGEGDLYYDRANDLGGGAMGKQSLGRLPPPGYLPGGAQRRSGETLASVESVSAAASIAYITGTVSHLLDWGARIAQVGDDGDSAGRWPQPLAT